MTSALRKIALIGATGALALSALAAPALAVTWATVDGYESFDSEKNSADWWEANYDVDECTKDDSPSGDTVLLDKSWALVVVKGGSDGDYANTIFEDAASGETVWADTNGNGSYDGGPDDKGASHVIYCDEVEATPTPGGSVGEETDPPTDTAVTSGTTSDSLGLVLMALAGVLATVLVLTPARARRR